MVTPWEVDVNGNSYPAGSSEGSQGSFVSSKKTLFTSNSNGDYAAVAMTYAIANDPTFGATDTIPSTQAGGNYPATVTFQIELQ